MIKAVGMARSVGHWTCTDEAIDRLPKKDALGEKMVSPVIHGPAFSTYTRSVRLTLEEKGVPYVLEEVNILIGENQTDDFLLRCPFGKVPAFEHEDFQIFETAPTMRYIDEAFDGPDLQPADVRARARMGQIMGIVDSYGYQAIISKIVIQRLVQPLLGGTVDESVVKEAVPMAEKSITVLDALIGEQEFAVGSEISLADLHLAPVLDYFSRTPEGETALASAPNLSRWWSSIRDRPSVVKTAPQLA